MTRTMKARTAAAALAVLMLGGCADNGKIEDLEATMTDMEGQLDAVATELETANSTISDLEAELTEAEQEIADQKAQALTNAQERDDALDAQVLAEDRADKAEAAAEKLRNRYDPQIQEQLAAVQADAEEIACATATNDAVEQVWERTKVGLAIDEAVSRFPDELQDAARDKVNVAAVQARADECFNTANAEIAAQALVGPHGDGFWTVGVEIAAGVWQSDGTGDGCYWQISPVGAPDDIIDNHFGNAGGTITIRDGQEVEFDDCGIWTKVG